MRVRFIRFATCVVVVGVGSLSLSACSKDKVKEPSAAEVRPFESAAVGSAASIPVESATARSSQQGAPVATVDLTKVVSTPNIFYTAVGAGSFLTLANLLVAADLLETVKDGGPFTVFAPTDDAFAAVPPATLNAVAADKAKLTKVLLYHVVPGSLKVEDLKEGDLKTAEGGALKITKLGDTFLVNGNPIAAGDVVASNGIIHVMGSVLLPPDL